MPSHKRCGCTAIFSDAFSDSSDDVFARWGIFAGDWTWDAGEFVYTADANAILLLQNHHGGGAVNITEPKRVAVEVKVRFTDFTTGDEPQAQVWLGDSQPGPIIDRFSAELEYGSDDCGVLRIQENTTISVGPLAAINVGPVALDAWHTLRLCYHWRSAELVDLVASLTLSDGRYFRLPVNLPDVSGYSFPVDDGPNITGLASRQLGSGQIDFDDYKLLPLKEDAPCGCCPDCLEKCPVATDDFNRAEVGCCWREYSVGLLGNFSITGEELVQDDTAATLIQYACSEAPDAFRWALDFYIPTSGDAGIILYDVESDLSGFYYEGQLTPGAECGTLQIRQVEIGVGTTNLGEEVVIPGLTPATWHRVTLCYDPAHEVLTVRVGDYAHHAKGITLAGAAQYVGMRVSSGGGYKFDRARLVRSGDGETVYAGGYYDYYQPDCPCCFVAGCEAVEGLALLDDCRLDVLAGAVDGATMEASTTILIRQGWGGVDADCLADPTQLIEVVWTGTNYGDVLRVYLDWVDGSTNHYAQLTLNADSSTQGTLKIFKNGVEVDSENVTALPGTTTLRFCYDQVTATAIAGSERLEVDSDGNGGLLAAFGTGTLTSDVTVQSVSVSHKLYEGECEDCGPAGNCFNEDGVAIPGYMRLNFIPPILDYGLGCDPGSTDCADALAGTTFIVPFFQCNLVTDCHQTILEEAGVDFLPAPRIAAYVISLGIGEIPTPCDGANLPFAMGTYIIREDSGKWWLVGWFTGAIPLLQDTYDMWVTELAPGPDPPDLFAIDEVLPHFLQSALGCIRNNVCDFSSSMTRIRSA